MWSRGFSDNSWKLVVFGKSVFFRGEKLGKSVFFRAEKVGKSVFFRAGKLGKSVNGVFYSKIELPLRLCLTSEINTVLIVDAYSLIISLRLFHSVI